MKLIAYDLDCNSQMEIEPGCQRRVWADSLPNKFANRCLPMLMANQSGWVIKTTAHIRAHWTGGPETSDLIIATNGEIGPEHTAVSHFGHGVLTFCTRWLFRTEPGYNLAVRGCPNLPKHGIAPLDGLVETDWSPSTFTMNWQFTAPGEIVFQPGEPIAFVFPQLRGELEKFEPEVRPIKSDATLFAQYEIWARFRKRFNEQLHVKGSEQCEKGWQREYFTGQFPHMDRFEEHQTKRVLREFSRRNDELE